LIDRPIRVCYVLRTELEKNNSNKRSRRMKKLSITVVALLVAGAVSSWAQVSNIINTTSNEVAGFVFGPVPISFTGKLSDKTTISASTLADLAPGGGTLEFAESYDVAGLHTGPVVMVIGTSLGTSNVVSGSSTGVTAVGYTILRSYDYVDSSKSTSTKFVSGWIEDGFGRINGSTTDFLFTVQAAAGPSNAALLVTGTLSDSKTTNGTAKVVGVWHDGATTISATIGKPKK
jgi:hypothetical protein